MIATARPDGLLHLAWCARPPDYWRSPDNLRWLAASLDLVRLFVEHGGQRIVGVGSCAEYDWRQGYCTEGVTPLLPASLYGVTKAACGSAIEAYAGETGISAAWGRLFFLYGPFDSPVRLVPSLVRSLSAGQPARCADGQSHSRFSARRRSGGRPGGAPAVERQWTGEHRVGVAGQDRGRRASRRPAGRPTGSADD